MANFEENYHFSRFQRGSNISQPRGGPTFFQGGGSNCLFPLETHITFDFLGGGGSGLPVPPLDPHLSLFKILVTNSVKRFTSEFHLAISGKFRPIKGISKLRFQILSPRKFKIIVHFSVNFTFKAFCWDMPTFAWNIAH